MCPLEKLRPLFAPEGKLRASINLGNAVLARRDSPKSSPYGVSVDIAKELAARLNVELQLVVFDSARQSVDAVASDQADIGFFAIDPNRGEAIAFTDAYLHIEGWYVVREDSPIMTLDAVDHPGIRVVVNRGSAYDLFLSRALSRAEIVRTSTPQEVTATFIEQGLEVAAGIKQQIELDMQRYSGLRLLPERFMLIRQAMGLARGRHDEALTYLGEFVEDLKATGFIAQALQRHNIEGTSLAPTRATSAV